jgi:hypothetical protein
MKQPIKSDFDFESLDLASLNIEGMEVVTLKEAMALPETGASSAISICHSCSSCGSSSCYSEK